MNQHISQKDQIVLKAFNTLPNCRYTNWMVPEEQDGRVGPGYRWQFLSLNSNTAYPRRRTSEIRPSRSNWVLDYEYELVS